MPKRAEQLVGSIDTVNDHGGRGHPSADSGKSPPTCVSAIADPQGVIQQMSGRNYAPLSSGPTNRKMNSGGRGEEIAQHGRFSLLGRTARGGGALERMCHA